MSNRLLLALDEAALVTFRARATPVSLPRGTPLFQPFDDVHSVYFLESGIAAIIAESEDRRSGTAIIGREGYLLPSTVLGIDAVPNRSEMLVGGHALRMAVGPFRDLMTRNPSFSDILHRFAYVLIAQLMSTLLSRSSENVESQLARLLLMVHDRCETDDIAITHESCAAFLSVRRTSVTGAMHVLEGRGAIANERGCVSIKSRRRLQEFVSFSSYGKAEREYDRVIGSTLRSI